MPLLKRRDFLLVSGAAASGVLFAGCVPPRHETQAESRVLMAEDILSANDTWYATTCRGCAAGCGLVVRVVDGRARKAEGNPDHPVNRGKLCARGQAVVQEQYHPDRVRRPLFQGAAVDWNRGLDELVSRLRTLRTNGRAADVALITPPLRGDQAFLVDGFARTYGLQWMPFEPLPELALVEASRRVFGTPAVPRFDVQHARMVLSIGADFLGGWVSPVNYSIQYGAFRGNRPRGRLVHVEARFSQTAAAADEWVWIRPGTEGLLALSLARELGAAGLDDYAPEHTAERTGVDAERVRRIARELRTLQPSVVIGGGSAGAHTNGTDALTAILGLNALLGQPAGVTVPAQTPWPTARPIAEWQDLIARMSSGQVQAVLLLGGANPVHGLPASIGFTDALRRVPFVASFNSFLDDSTGFAHLVLPANLPLEDWGDDDIPEGVSIQQPVVQPLFDTRSVWDVLLTLADELGDDTRAALPWTSYKDLLRDHLVSGPNAAQAWTTLLQHGGRWDATTSATSTSRGQPQFAQFAPYVEAELDGDPAAYPFALILAEHNTLGTGESAHLPWLQAAPDPITSVTWQTWVELNPVVADRLRVAEGDLVRVESPHGTVDVPVYISPATSPEVAVVPLGQGHTGFGRWADGRGANPLALLGTHTDTNGALAYASARVKLTKLGKHMPLPKLEGIAPARQLPGKEVLPLAYE